MEITEITVSYGQTQSLPEYSNVKPMVTLKATIGEDEDPHVVRRNLFEMARAFVEAEIDDALERHDRPAVYSQEARFRVIATRQSRNYGEPSWMPLENVVAIVPNEVERPEGGDWHSAQSAYSDRGVRHRHALTVARREANSRGALRIIDCSDGDLSRLPQRPRAEVEPEPQSEPAEDLGF